MLHQAGGRDLAGRLVVVPNHHRLISHSFKNARWSFQQARDAGAEACRAQHALAVEAAPGTGEGVMAEACSSKASNFTWAIEAMSHRNISIN